MSSASGGFDFGGGGFALNGDGVEQHVEAGVAAGDDVEEVADDGAGGRGDDADGAGKGGQRALAVGVEEALGLEALLELLEGQLQRAGADGLHGLGDQLHLAALLVDADAAAHQHVQAVFGAEAEQHGLAAEEHDGELGVGVLEREVDVAGGRGAVVGDLALDPDVAVLLLDRVRGPGRRVRGRARCGGYGAAPQRESRAEAQLGRVGALLMSVIVWGGPGGANGASGSAFSNPLSDGEDGLVIVHLPGAIESGLHVRADVFPANVRDEFRLLQKFGGLAARTAKDQRAAGTFEPIAESFQGMQASGVDGSHVAQAQDDDRRELRGSAVSSASCRWFRTGRARECAGW